MSGIALKEKDILRKVYRLARQRRVKLYLVGGYLRDALLKREKDDPDIDFCIKRGAVKFGRSIRRQVKAGFVVLDQEHGCCRLVKKLKGKVCTLDFTDFRGKTLDQDLLHRDFTINAMAAELGGVLKDVPAGDIFIDPCAGQKDLKAKLIRAANKKSFDEDPLRILRAFSLAAIFGFKIDKETLRLIKLKKKKLSRVSGERLRDELFKILDRPDAFKYLLQLDQLRILSILLPEIDRMRGVSQGPYHHLDVWKHTLESVRQLEILFRERGRNKDIRDYLNQSISAGRSRRALIKLGALLHDIGKPRAKRRRKGKTIFHGHERIGLKLSEDIARRLKLSNDEREALRKMVLWHLRPGYLADNETLTARARFRYFRDTAGEGVSTLLLSIADQRATRGRLTTSSSRVHHEETVLSLIREYFRRSREKKLPRLINGDQLIRRFRLSPSPIIGKILSGIEELQAIGKIKTRAQALKAAAILVKKSVV
ncbi:HD domain-containing protein [Candidatus Omnitrophota bacterium]